MWFAEVNKSEDSSQSFVIVFLWRFGKDVMFFDVYAAPSPKQCKPDKKKTFSYHTGLHFKGVRGMKHFDILSVFINVCVTLPFCPQRAVNPVIAYWAPVLAWYPLHSLSLFTHTRGLKPSSFMSKACGTSITLCQCSKLTVPVSPASKVN